MHAHCTHLFIELSVRLHVYIRQKISSSPLVGAQQFLLGQQCLIPFIYEFELDNVFDIDVTALRFSVCLFVSISNVIFQMSIFT